MCAHLNIQGKTVRLLKENIGEYLPDYSKKNLFKGH